LQLAPAMPNNVFVANLSLEERYRDLKGFFQSGGDNVVSVKVLFHDNPRSLLDRDLFPSRRKK